MTSAEKLTMLKTLLGISDTSKDTLLGTYLDFAKRETVSWRYGYSTYPNIAKATDSEDVPIAVRIGAFASTLSPTSGLSYVFTYSESAESWQYEIAGVDTDVDLTEYGIEYSEYCSPVDGETITVKYSETPLAEFDTVQVMACVAGYGLRGLENQTSSTENGITRQFKYSDMVDYLHANIPAYCGVV